MSVANSPGNSRETLYQPHRKSVIRGLHTPLLGKPAIEALQLLTFLNGIKLDDIIKQFPTLFTGLRRLKDSYKIKLKAGATPYALSVPR